MVEKNEREITISEPGEHQLDVLFSPARHKVLICGRRWGKTTLALDACVCGHGPDRMFPGALQGAHVVWVCTSFPNVEQVWAELKRRLAPVWIQKSEIAHRIDFPGGGVLYVRSGDDPDALRGFRFDGAVIDEAASQKEAVWKDALAPALTDSDGWVIFLGTPKGRDNWFFTLFEEALELPGWERWQRPSSDNPLMTPEKLEARRREVGAFTFAREYEAQFVVASGGMLDSKHFKYYDPLSAGRLQLQGVAGSVAIEKLWRFATCDLAVSKKTKADWSAISTWGVDDDKHLILLDVRRVKESGATLLKSIAEVTDRWDLPAVWIEETAYHELFMDIARSIDIPVRRLEAVTDKVQRFEPAVACFENGRIFLPRVAKWLDTLTAEILAFPDKSSKDDQVDTVSYAVQVAYKKRGRFNDEGESTAPDPEKPGPRGGPGPIEMPPPRLVRGLPSLRPANWRGGIQ